MLRFWTILLVCLSCSLYAQTTDVVTDNDIASSQKPQVEDLTSPTPSGNTKITVVIENPQGNTAAKPQEQPKPNATATPNTNGWNILHEAVNNTPENLAVLLNDIQNLPLINQGDNLGYTPLHYAAMRGDTKSVSLLLSKSNIVINKTAKNGRTALHTASVEGYKDVAKILFDADESCATKTDSDGNSCLTLATQGRKRAEALKKTAKVKEYDAILQMFKKAGIKY